MAGLNLKLVNKLSRRARSVKKKQRGEFDKENKLERVMRKSPRAYKLSRKAQRREDRNFGNDMLAQKPLLSFEAKASVFERHDYSGLGDFGMRLTLAAGLEAAIGLRVGDIIQVRQGNAKGHELAVVALTDSTHLRLDDLASYAFIGLPEITHITTVADVAGSLNNKYFDINSADDVHKYYVWFDDGTGVDPAPAGRTGVHIVYSDGASASTLAGLVRSALNALAGTPFTASGSGANIIVTNSADGATTDASDAGATGFSISVTQQGVDDNPTPSENNINFRALLSSEKASYK